MVILWLITALHVQSVVIWNSFISYVPVQFLKLFLLSAIKTSASGLEVLVCYINFMWHHCHCLINSVFVTPLYLVTILVKKALHITLRTLQ